MKLMSFDEIVDRIRLPLDVFREKYAPESIEFDTTTFKIPGVLDEVGAEMSRQITKWGQQNHKSFTTGDVIGGTLQADFAKTVCDSKSRHGRVSWNDIFLEEVFEARDEAIVGNLDKLRTELIQCAAVALSWVESIDRNKH